MVPLSQLLAVPGLDLRPVHLAPRAPAVRWVATSELVDPTPFLEGRELLLTTGLESAGWSAATWRSYVARLVGAGAAALGLGTGLTHETPPQSLVTACRELGLTLLEVPRGTPFVAISLAAANLLRDEQERVARAVLQAQRELTRVAVRLDVGPLVARLATLVDGAAATVHRDGSLSEGPHGPLAAELDVDLVAQEVRRLRAAGAHASAAVSTPGGTTVVRPLGARGRADTFLAVHLPGPLRDPARSAITTAAALLGLALARREDRRAAERRLHERALELLLHGDRRTATVLLDSAEAPTRLPGRVRVVRAAGPEEEVEDALLGLEATPSLAAVRGSDLVVVAAEQRAATVADGLVTAGLRVGVGRATTLAEAAASAETAAHALAQTGPLVPLRHWEELTAAGPMGLIPPELASSYAASVLSGLDATLLATLSAFLRHHGSRGAVAVELGVHRNTVRNRVEELERRLGSLDDPQVRVAAWIALQAVR